MSPCTCQVHCRSSYSINNPTVFPSPTHPSSILHLLAHLHLLLHPQSTSSPIHSPPKPTSYNLSKCQKTTTAKTTRTNPPARTPLEITIVPVTTAPEPRTAIRTIIVIRMGVITIPTPMGVSIITMGRGVLRIRLLVMELLEGPVEVVGMKGRVRDR
jgi:hypothetical protein